LVPIALVYGCACVCKEWRDALFEGTDGLLVPPVALRWVSKPNDYQWEDREQRAVQWKKMRMKVTVQCLAWVLQRFPRLRALSLTGWCEDMDTVQRRLAVLLECTEAWNSYDSSFGFQWPVVDDHLALAIGRWCPRLEFLPGCRFDETFSSQALAHLAARQPRLRALAVQSSTVPAPSTKMWIAALSFPHLRSLNVSYIKFVTDDVLVTIAKGCPKLEDLSLPGTRVGDRGIRFLAKGGFPCLRAIAMGDLRVSSAVVRELLCSAMIARVHTLDLYNHALLGTDLQLLTKHCPTLAWLSLQNDDFTPLISQSELSTFIEASGANLRGLRLDAVFSNALARTVGASCPRLSHFLVGGIDRSHDFSDAGLRAVLEGCPHLKVLDVAFCEGLSLFGRRWGAGPQRFATLLAELGGRLRWVSVHGCSHRALSLLRRTLPLAYFDHDGYIDTSIEVEYKDTESIDSLMQVYGIQSDSDDSFHSGGDDDEDEEDDDGEFDVGDHDIPTTRGRARAGAGVVAGVGGGRGRGGRATAAKAKAKGKAKAKAKVKAKAKAKGKAKAALRRPRR